MGDWPENPGTRRLHDWLERSSWTLTEAAEILSGVDPDEHRPGDRRPGFWPLFPGIPWSTDSAGHLSLHAQLIKNIAEIKDALRARPVKDRTPAGYLRWARQQTPPIVPPWRGAARDCCFCMAAVGAELPDTFSESQKRKRAKQVEHSRREVDAVVLPILKALHAIGFEDTVHGDGVNGEKKARPLKTRDGKVVFTRLAKKVEKRFGDINSNRVPDRRTCERYVKERLAAHYPQVPTSARKPTRTAAVVAT